MQHSLTGRPLGPAVAQQRAKQQHACGRIASCRSQKRLRVQAAASTEPAAAVDLQQQQPELDEKQQLSQMMNRPYKYGFKTFIESDTFPKGLNEDVVRAISAKKNEPEWMLEFRLRAFKKWLTMEEPHWSDNRYPVIDFQDLSYYSAPKMKEKKASLDEVDPELLRTFDKLGIPLNEQKRLANVAVDAVFDSVSIATTFREELGKAGVIFCSISEAVKEYPELVRKHLGSVVSDCCSRACRKTGGGKCWAPATQQQQQQQQIVACMVLGGCVLLRSAHAAGVCMLPDSHCSIRYIFKSRRVA